MKKISFKIATLAIISNIIILTIIGLFSFYLISESNKSRVNDMDRDLRNSFDNLVKTQIENVISLLNEYNKKVESGDLKLDEAKKQAADQIRELRYGEDGYFWVDTVEGLNLVLLGGETEGTNRYELKDVKGFPLIKEIIKNGQKEGGGFTNYHFPKANTTKPLPKRSYSLEFKPFQWVVGTGNYTNDIDELVEKEENEINKRYKEALIWLIIASVISIILSSIVAISVSNKISKPIKMSSEYLKILSSGDLSVDYDFENHQNNKDETGILIKSLKSMRDSLYIIINNINKQATKVYSVSNNSKEKIEKLKENIDNISISTEQLSATMEETAASTEELNAVNYDIQVFSANIAKELKKGVSNEKDIYEKYNKAKKIINLLSDKESSEDNKKQLANVVKAMEFEIKSNLEHYHEFIKDLSISAQNLNDNIESSVSSISQLGETNTHSAEEILEIAKNTAYILKESNIVLDLSKESRNCSLNLLEVIKKFILTK